MTRFQLAVRTANITTNNAVCEIIAGASKGCRVLNMNAVLATGVTGVFGIGRPLAKGITPTTPTAFLPIDGGDPLVSQATVATAWGTSPTAPPNYFHRASMPATVGAIRDFILNQNGGPGIWVPAGTTLVLFNITGGPTMDLSLDINE